MGANPPMLLRSLEAVLVAAQVRMASLDACQARGLPAAPDLALSTWQARFAVSSQLPLPELIPQAVGGVRTAV